MAGKGGWEGEGGEGLVAAILPTGSGKEMVAKQQNNGPGVHSWKSIVYRPPGGTSWSWQLLFDLGHVVQLMPK